jgi:hypothetical protein
MVAVVAVASLALSLFAGAPAADDPPPPPGQVTIEKVKVNGSGCHPATAATAISPDNQAFTVTYSEYIASLGPGVKPAQDHKDCKIKLRFNGAPGMTYAVVRADYRGYGLLQPGVVGKFTAEYSFEGPDPAVVMSHKRAGPFDDFWQFSDQLKPLKFGPCGKDRQLKIDTDLILTPGAQPITAVSSVGVDSADGEVNKRLRGTFGLVWKKC